jgi:hypothetical protein
MQTTLMNITRTLTLGALAAAAAFAQTTGTITVNGSIPPSISMTNTSNTLLTATSSLGVLIAKADSALVLGDQVDVRIRSNQQFKLNAAANFTNTGAGTADGGVSISPSDIGFGITAKDVALSNVVSSRTNDLIPTMFDYRTTTLGSFSTSALAINGKTPFVAGTNGTLNDIGTSAQVMTGNRISKLGNIKSDDNFMLLSFNVATLPQYFTPTTGFQAVITLTPVTF